LLKSGIIVVVGKLGRFKLGILRVGKLSGGKEVETDVPVGRVNPLVCKVGNPLLVVKDGRLRDGRDNVGRVGTVNGGKPVADMFSPVLIGKVVFGTDWSGNVDICGMVVGNVVGNVIDGSTDGVGSDMVGIPDTCGTVDNEGKPGEGIMPRVGRAAGTAPPGTDVVADGIAIPSEDASIMVVVGRLAGTAVGTGAAIGTDATGTEGTGDGTVA